jgi:hypothetical protein
VAEALTAGLATTVGEPDKSHAMRYSEAPEIVTRNTVARNETGITRSDERSRPSVP